MEKIKKYNFKRSAKKKNYIKIKFIIEIKYFILLILFYIIFNSYYLNIKISNNNDKFNFNNIQRFYINKNNNKYNNLNIFIKYIKRCKSLKRIKNKNKIKNEFPFLSVCIPAYNSEKYIEKSILSVINQSFQDFEIIVINDFSNDGTLIKLKKLQNEDNRIKIINLHKNFGTYHSRVEGILNSKGKYIFHLDPDDMILNPFLFEILYYYYLKYNLDIIEFTVFYQKEEENILYYPTEHEYNHNHNFSKKIIYQPELSNIIYYKPQSKNYSSVICRTIWNKLYKKNLLLKAIYYIGKDYYEKYYIVIVEDTLLNIINFHFANNYTNINILGYLYNIRESSITHLEEVNEVLIKKSVSFFLYYQLLYRYIKEYDKDRNYLYHDLILFGLYILNLKKYNVKFFLKKAQQMFMELVNDKKISNEFKEYINLHYQLLLH